MHNTYVYKQRIVRELQRFEDLKLVEIIASPYVTEIGIQLYIPAHHD